MSVELLVYVLIPISIIVFAGAIAYLITKATDDGSFGIAILYTTLFVCVVFMTNPNFKEYVGELIQPQETTQTTENAIDVPDGYKFVEMDDEGRYYIIEDAEGNQQVIIIEKNEK